ncbi:PEGA domain-containing protein [Mucilaginibacter sp. HMF5004]|uniref:PEGA domain-containing protein n=1 Tax=Mucilaginibacter rivuli TaxID=2857527 RepID=UPI001C5E4145|nr:PEGA domain-containing protein [Mucilaginibacter rivuli]MBW4891114.1 PEGA domain-containing protein [Mucilaginibacter rivuli]
MNKLLSYFLILTIAFTCTSCASIIKGTTQTIHVTSEPPGADIEINGVPHGKTPTDVVIKKSIKGEPIVLKKAGYEDKVFTPPVVFDQIAILNLFGLVGWGVDYFTGAIMQYAPTSYSIPLTPLKK